MRTTVLHFFYRANPPQKNTTFFNPLSNMPILDSSHSSSNKDMRSKIYGQMGIHFSDRVENIVGKGEIACDEQFLRFPHCFQNIFI